MLFFSYHCGWLCFLTLLLLASFVALIVQIRTFVSITIIMLVIFITALALMQGLTQGTILGQLWGLIRGLAKAFGWLQF